MTAPLLQVEDLRVDFASASGTVHAVRGVSLQVRPGSVVGVVGESGSGKSVTAMALLGLLLPPGRLVHGSFRWGGEPVSWPQEVRRLRGEDIGMVFQDPLVGLNPLVRIGRQITEVMVQRGQLDRATARDRAIELLHMTGVSAPELRVRQYPSELSGGMAQRVMISMALAAGPKLLVADEPTSALDVTVQAQILDVLAELQSRLNLSVVFVTHDFGIVSSFCDEVYVMYAGQIVESGPTAQVVSRPRHPYTIALLNAIPRIEELDRPLAPSLRPAGSGFPETGCAFAPRCPLATQQCVDNDPVLVTVAQDQNVGCWHADQT